ncbi:hypothetical protein BVRB_7g175060 [Beta vulgaris subsp. vulgaris]|nr:hypothetical protein BVRB_7g175060 [Beta vulgaris subsp. vulgaris]
MLKLLLDFKSIPSVHVESTPQITAIRTKSGIVPKLRGNRRNSH